MKNTVYHLPTIKSNQYKKLCHKFICVDIMRFFLFLFYKFVLYFYRMSV